MENYLITFVLDWKLTYFTPFDYLSVILPKFSLQYPSVKLNTERIMTKAIHIIEFLFLCISLSIKIAIDVFSICSPYSVAVVALYSSIRLSCDSLSSSIFSKAIPMDDKVMLKAHYNRREPINYWQY